VVFWGSKQNLIRIYRGQARLSSFKEKATSTGHAQVRGFFIWQKK